eukprot:gene10831-7502_t
MVLRISLLRQGQRHSSSTAQLETLCRRTRWRPAAGQVHRLVVPGNDKRRSPRGEPADVMRRYRSSSSRGSTLLHQLVLHGHTAAVEACLQTPRKLNLRRSEERLGQTLFSLACQKWIRPQDSAELLDLLTARLETHTGDEVHWGQEDRFGEELLAIAARHHRLAAVWRLILERGVPYFLLRRRIMRLPLVWERDWQEAQRATAAVHGARYHHHQEVLGDAGDIRCYFDTSRTTFLTAPRRSTELLCLESWLLNPSPRRVEQYVRQGKADVLYPDPQNGKPILHNLLEKLLVQSRSTSPRPPQRAAAASSPVLACIEACLHSPRPIDFTRCNWLQENPVLSIWASPGLRSEDAAALMTMLLRRFERGPRPSASAPSRRSSAPLGVGGDRVALNKVEGGIHVFLSACASGSHFHLLWRLLRRRPRVIAALQPVSLRGTPIPIASSTPSASAGLQSLSRRDQRRFTLAEHAGHPTFGKVELCRPLKPRHKKKSTSSSSNKSGRRAALLDGGSSIKKKTKKKHFELFDSLFYLSLEFVIRFLINISVFCSTSIAAALHASGLAASLLQALSFPVGFPALLYRFDNWDAHTGYQCLLFSDGCVSASPAVPTRMSHQTTSFTEWLTATQTTRKKFFNCSKKFHPARARRAAMSTILKRNCWRRCLRRPGDPLARNRHTPAQPLTSIYFCQLFFVCFFSAFSTDASAHSHSNFLFGEPSDVFHHIFDTGRRASHALPDDTAIQPHMYQRESEGDKAPYFLRFLFRPDNCSLLSFPLLKDFLLSFSSDYIGCVNYCTRMVSIASHKLSVFHGRPALLLSQFLYGFCTFLIFSLHNGSHGGCGFAGCPSGPLGYFKVGGLAAHGSGPSPRLSLARPFPLAKGRVGGHVAGTCWRGAERDPGPSSPADLEEQFLDALLTALGHFREVAATCPASLFAVQVPAPTWESWSGSAALPNRLAQLSALMVSSQQQLDTAFMTNCLTEVAEERTAMVAQLTEAPQSTSVARATIHLEAAGVTEALPCLAQRMEAWATMVAHGGDRYNG